MEIKTLSDNKSYILLYTDWHRVGFSYKHNIVWKVGGEEYNKTYTIGFLLYFLLSRASLDKMIKKNINDTLEQIYYHRGQNGDF